MTPTAAVPSIIPTGIYDDTALYEVLGITGPALARARRDGELKYTRKGNRTLYLGEWVLAWLTGEAAPRKGATDE
jgi:hypothetical protein